MGGFGYWKKLKDGMKGIGKKLAVIIPKARAALDFMKPVMSPMIEKNEKIKNIWDTTNKGLEFADNVLNKKVDKKSDKIDWRTASLAPKLKW